MSSIADLSGATVRRASIRGVRSDALAARRSTERMLAGIDDSVPGLDASAILCVRCVALRLPMRAGPALRPSQALAAEMERHVRVAARPALGPIPANAEAIVFADEAELAACLAGDWLQGRVAQRWWWDGVLAGLAPMQWLQQRVLARGELLVPTITVLARHALAEAWLARLEDAQAEQALVCIGRSHALPRALAPGATPEHQTAGPAARARRDAVTDACTQAQAQVPAPVGGALRPAALERLLTLVPEALAPTLRPAQRRLLAVALALARAPTWARTPQLARALAALDRHGLADPLPRHVAVEESATDEERASPAPGGVRDEPTGAGRPRAPAPRAHAVPRTSAVAAQPAGWVAHGLAAASAMPTASLVAAGMARAAHLAVAAVQQAQGSVAAASSAAVTAPPALQTLRLQTDFGGLFYLLNAALALGWYSDFSAPRGPNLALSPWDWLALVGRAWFARSFTRDPVAGLLAQLAGREGRAPRRPRRFQAQLDALHTRLQQALGAEGDVTALVCRHPAQVVATPTRVDVHLALAELPLALRLAGLDRDPGWVPAAGRALAFHFE